MGKRMDTRARRTSRLLGCLISLTLIAAACSDSGEAGSSGGNVGGGDGTDDGSQGGGGLDTSRARGGDKASEGEPVHGGTVVFGLDRDVISFDIAIGGSNMAANAMYDSLMKFDDDGIPQPYMAESIETSDEGATWRLALRPEVEFHDGTPLDAEAVIFNIQRHIDDPTSFAHTNTQRIESMEAVEEFVVEFVLTEPWGGFPVVFAQPWAQGNLGTIASPTAIETLGEEEFRRNPVGAGAGPFEFVEWIPDNRVVLLRNDNYWQEGLPYLDRVEFRPLSDTETRYASVENGDVDMIFAGYHTEVLRGSQDPDLDVYYGTGGGAEYMYFNHTRPPFDDRRMREAFIRAINPEALSSTQFRGAMDPATTVFGEDSPFFSQEASDIWPTYDPELARELIDEYIADGGDPSFTLRAPNSPNRVLFAEFIQTQFAAIGLEIDVQFADLAQFASDVVRSGEFQVTTWVTGPWDNPYPNVLQLYTTDGSANYGGYSNPDVDAAIDAAVVTADEDERIEFYQEAQRIANEDLMVAWYSRGYLGAVSQPHVKGVERYLSRDTFFAEIWLDRQ